ncbi:hypothetical protein [Paraflavitalea soli]|nr:hypothetical protein [Paraflavitalea soli]
MPGKMPGSTYPWPYPSLIQAGKGALEKHEFGTPNLASTMCEPCTIHVG